MAFVTDSFTPSSGTSGVSTSIAATGSGRYALAFIYAENEVTITGNVTYGGNTMTAISGANLNSTIGGICQVFGLANPPTGSQTVSATLSGMSGRCWIYAQVWDGVNAVGNGDATFGEVPSSSLDANSVAGDEVVSFCVVATGDGITMGGTGQTNREEQDNVDEAGRSFGCATKTASSTSTTMVWTPASTCDCAHVSVAITPTASGSTLTADRGQFTFTGQEATLSYSEAGGAGGQFGRTTVGASWISFEARRRGRSITLAAEGTATKISAYIRSVGSAVNGSRASLYNDSDDTLAYQSSVLSGFTDTTGQWRDYTFTSTVATGTYWLTIFADGVAGGGNTIEIATDTVSNNAALYETWFNDAQVWPTQSPDLTGLDAGEGNDQDISIYMETQGGLSLNAEGTTYSHSGKAAALIYTRKLTASLGTYALAGSEAYRDIEIDNNVGAFVLAGQSANLGVGHKLYADAASGFSMSGQDIIMLYSAAGPKEIDADAAGFSHTGYDTTLRLGKKLTADYGQFIVFGQPVVGGVPPDTGTKAGGVFKVKRALIVSTSGRTKWVHYIPIKQVTVSDINKGTYNNDGAIEVNLLSSAGGRTEWVDYVPVVQVSDIEYERWRTDNTGWIPVIFVE